MKKTLIFTALACFFLLPGHAFGYGEPVEKYFPLKPGATWVYQVQADKGTRSITVTNLAPREVDGQTMTPRKWDSGGALKYYLIARDDFGFYRYAELTSENEEPKAISPRVYYLKSPVEDGNAWDITTKLGLEDLTVSLTIEGTNDEVKVPAGTYKNCVKIKHAGSGTSREKSEVDLSLTAYEWYAPGVGLVKSLVTIKTTPKGQPASTEHATYQLESFKP
jgi:hypothetical protein